jgi:predicted alpha/beta superfamily hydrolase
MKNILIIAFLLLKINFIYSKIEITILVEDVPKYYTPLNDEIFLTGTFNSWRLNDENYKLTRLSHESFIIKISLDYGEYEYKFCRGEINTIETNIDGKTLNNRVLSVKEKDGGKTFKVKIENWNDMIGNHTSTGNVFILDSKFPFPSLNTTKKILIYLPPDYFTTFNKTYPVLYIHDGHVVFDQFFNRYEADYGFDEIMENFHKQKQQTSIMVGIPQTLMVERTDQLTPFPNFNFPTGTDSPGGKGDLYLENIVDHLKPYVDKNFRTKSHRNYTGIIGVSLGGLISFYAGIKYQEVFSKIGAFSATYLWNDTIYSYAQNSPVLYKDTKFNCIVGLKENGTYEGVLYDMVTTMKKMVNILRGVGYKNVFDKVYEDGEHDDWFWIREFPRAYRYFFLNEASSATKYYLSFWILIYNLVFIM